MSECSTGLQEPHKSILLLVLTFVLQIYQPSEPKPKMTEKTAIILIDPYKDFLHPQGKLYPGLAASLAENNTIEHFKQLVTVARAHNIPIYYGLHQQHHEGFAAGWKHKTELQQMQIDSKFSKKGAGVSSSWKD